MVAILRVVEKLSPKGDEEIEDDNVESLQASLSRQRLEIGPVSR